MQIVPIEYLREKNKRLRRWSSTQKSDICRRIEDMVELISYKVDGIRDVFEDLSSWRPDLKSRIKKLVRRIRRFLDKHKQVEVYAYILGTYAGYILAYGIIIAWLLHVAVGVPFNWETITASGIGMYLFEDIIQLWKSGER